MSAATCIVVPCFNEARRLNGRAFVRFVRSTPDVRFLFVDDGSTDGTPDVLAQLCEARPSQLASMRLPRNSGKAEAVRLGVLNAIAAGDRLVGYWDADLATPLDALQAFRRVLNDAPWLELVMGSRVQLLGRHIERHPTRHYLGRMFATAASLALGLRVYDTQCGAKLFRVTPAVADIFAQPFRSRWIFDVEILARMVRQRGPAELPADQVVYELPLTDWMDVGGSKLRARHFVLAFFQLMRVTLEVRRAVPVQLPGARDARPTPLRRERAGAARSST